MKKGISFDKFVLKDIGFERVFVASGTLNFFGQGWPHHKIYKRLFGDRFNFDNATFISKTTTLLPREGNMPFTYHGLQPKGFFPDCIKVYPFKGLMLNAVGLSGPGMDYLMRCNKWQKMEKPFLISFMSVAEKQEERIIEAKMFAAILKQIKYSFKAPFGVQVNISCPNTKHDTGDFFKEALALLEVFADLNVPLDLKIGVADALMAPIDFFKKLEDSLHCDCITCSNTIPWGGLQGKIDWQELFKTPVSPLAQYGGGGLSGKVLKPIVLDWLTKVRLNGISMPIKAGGGILSHKDAFEYVDGGADAVEIGCVSVLRPWRVKKIIDRTDQYFSYQLQQIFEKNLPNPRVLDRYRLN